ncbi:hypothetical protein Hanom_Chr15g01396531 [Helianthus anomalus]
MFNNPSGWANYLSTPISLSQLPPSIIPQFDAIELQTQNSPSHQHMTESTTTTMAVSEIPHLVIPQAVEEREVPSTKKKRASVDEPLETSPGPTADTTTTGGKSDDPINLGDGLRYQDLTERLFTMETIVTKMNESIELLVAASKSQPTPQQYSQELWNAVQPIITAQRELAEIQHNHQMALLRNMVDARYKDTQADIKAIKEALVNLTGTTPTSIYKDDDQDDDAQKGKKHDMKKFGRPTPNQKPETEKKVF